MEHRFSEDELNTFLALLRAGKNPTEAAQMVDPSYTASMFRRVTNEGNKQYSPKFAADYLRARAEGRQLSEPQRPTAADPRTTTLSGHLKAKYITEEMIDQFVEEVANGIPMKAAADKLNPKTSLSQLHKRALRDPVFAERYATAKEQGYPIFRENLRSEAVRQAMSGNYAALKDQLLIHDPEFRQVLLAQKHEIGGVGGAALQELVQRALPKLPPDVLDKLIHEIEQRQITDGSEDDENGNGAP